MTAATLSPLRSYSPVEVLARDPETGRALTVRLPTGHSAEFMRSEVDCMRAGLATLANRPYATVPEIARPDAGALAASQALADLGAWAHGLGSRLTYHDSPPTHRGAWLGAVPTDETGPGHCAVFCTDRLVHDPAAGFPLPPGHELVPVTLADVRWGITLDRLETP